MKLNLKRVKRTTWAVCAMALTLVLLEITVTYCYDVIADGASIWDNSTPLPLVGYLVSGLIGFFAYRVYAKISIAIVKLTRLLITTIANLIMTVVNAIFG